ncbi:MAG: SelB C-terminal domain-containing protein, partial [Acidimicrobiales bacterium]
TWTGQVVDPALVTGGRWVLSPEARGQAEDRLRHALAGSGPAGLELSLLDDLERSLVSALPGVTVSRGRARQAGATTGTGPGARDPGVAAWIESLEEQPFSPVPPGEAGITGTALREAVRAGDVVSSGGCYFAAAAVEEAARRLTGLFAARPDCEGVTVSEMRQLFGTSRKFAIPLLEELDARGLTRRRGDVRIAGPQLAGCDR